MFDDGIHATLTDLVLGLDPALQLLAVMAIGLVPFLESYVGALVGTVTGVPVVLATAAAVRQVRAGAGTSTPSWPPRPSPPAAAR